MLADKKETGGLFAGIFAAVAALIRPLPTLLSWAFISPVGGLALFSGARVSSRLAYALPLLVMIGTDIVLWTFKGPLYSPLHVSRPFVYGSFLLYVLLGRTLAKTRNPLRIGGVTLLGSLQFYLITNFASWLELTHLYSRDLAGLAQSFLAGLPFYGADDAIGFFGLTIIGDLVFTTLFFGIHAAYVRADERDTEVIQAGTLS